MKILYLYLGIALLLITHARGVNKIAIGPYFLDDPFVITGVTNGKLDARRSFGNNCKGFVSKQADAQLEITEDFEFLRIYVQSQINTTIIVKNDHTGEVFCNDNAKSITEIKRTPWPKGKYSIYVGREQKKSAANFELFVTEFKSYLKDFAAVHEDEQVVNITPNFSPDPYALSFEAGGKNLADQFGSNCKGYIADEPDHTIKLKGFFEYLKVYVESKKDTTLVMVSRLTTRSYCDDNGGSGSNPALSHRRLPAGTYDIYVGMHKPNQRAPYTLYISQKRP